VTEALSCGLLDGLDHAALAATVSAFTYEARAGRWRPEPRIPGVVSERVSRLSADADSLRAEEEAMRLTKTRRPDPGFAEAAMLWASGQRLERVLERSALSPGDFVRNAKQLSDLLRQIAVVAADENTASAAHDAARSIQRGVVAAGPALPVEPQAWSATARGDRS
jgi:ATP-dependent RNA helicase HelY